MSDPQLFEAASVPSVATDIVLLGSFAIDMQTREVLWNVPIHPDRRPVPVEDGVLYIVDGGRRLVSLQRVRRRVAWEPPTAIPGGVVVSARGEVERGDVEFESGGGARRERELAARRAAGRAGRRRGAELRARSRGAGSWARDPVGRRARGRRARARHCCARVARPRARGSAHQACGGVGGE